MSGAQPGPVSTLSANRSFGQEITLLFKPVFNQKQVRINDALNNKNGDSISIHTLKFYLGHFVFFKNNKIVWQEKDSYHLLDLEDGNSLNIVLKPTHTLDFDNLQFQLGIDSLTNVSGAFGGDLDPTKGMYWAWNSGYINFKIEGYAEKCTARNHGFQFHLGGYMPPFQSVQTVRLMVPKKENIQIDLELAPLFEHIDWANKHSIMSPSKEAVKLSELISTLFIVHE